MLEEMVRGARKGDREALAGLYCFLRQRFLPRIGRMVRNAHAAEDVFEEAFVKLYATYILSPKECWRGEGQFLRLFSEIIRTTAIDSIIRTGKVLPEKGNEEDSPVFWEEAYSPWRELKEKAEAILVGQEKRVSQGYVAMIEAFPYAHTLKKHERLRIVQQYSGLRGNAFHIAHHRMKKKVEKVLGNYRLGEVR
jgi:DNA-directed RNA polymerase specialized sigma24 family protein